MACGAVYVIPKGVGMTSLLLRTHALEKGQFLHFIAEVAPGGSADQSGQVVPPRHP